MSLRSIFSKLFKRRESDAPAPPAAVVVAPDFGVTQALRDAARVQVVNAEKLHPGQRGEYRRHVAYRTLCDAFPDEPKHVISFAIELALWDQRTAALQ